MVMRHIILASHKHINHAPTERPGSRQGSGAGRPRAGQRPPRKKTLAGSKTPKNIHVFGSDQKH